MGIFIYTLGCLIAQCIDPINWEVVDTFWFCWIFFGGLAVTLFEIIWAFNKDKFSLLSFIEYMKDDSVWYKSFRYWKKAHQNKERAYFIELSFKNFLTFYNVASNNEKRHPYIEIYIPYNSYKQVSWFPTFFEKGRKTQRGINGTLIIFKSIKDYHDYWKWANGKQKKKELFDKDAYAAMVQILEDIQKQHENAAAQQFSQAKEVLAQIQFPIEKCVQ